jgi:Cu/Ag efflux pump CusA
MSLGALDFGLIVDGAVIIVENALRGSRSNSIMKADCSRSRSGSRPWRLPRAR